MTNGPKNNYQTYNCKYSDWMPESEENKAVDRLVKRNQSHTKDPIMHLPNVAHNHAEHLTTGHNNCQDNRSKTLNCIEQEHLSYSTAKHIR